MHGGGEHQLRAFKERYKKDVAVLDMSNMKQYHDGDFNAADTICCKLQYINGNHYNLLVRQHSYHQNDPPPSTLEPQEDSSTPPGWDNVPPRSSDYPTFPRLRPSRFSDATVPNTISNEEMTATPAGWDSTLWRPLDEDTKRAVIRFIGNPAPTLTITEVNDSIGDNISTDDFREDDWNIDGNDSLSVDSGIFTAASNSDIGGNLRITAIDPGPTLETLLNDPNILADLQFEPIRYNLNKLKELNDESKSQSIGSKVRECPICLQNFRHLKTHQRYANSHQGCYNMARFREYLLWKRGIPFQRSSNSAAVFLYDDFPSLEKIILALPHFTR